MENTNPNDNAGADTKDPMYPETDANHEGDMPPAPAPAPAPDTSVADQISNDLSSEGQDKDAGEGVAKVETPLPFDFSKLSVPQLQALKAQLDATPDKRVRTQENPKARLRQVGEDIIEDFKSAMSVLTDDPENNRKVYRHVIPVKFFGKEAYVNMPYDEFINATQIELEVINERRKTQEVIVGTVFSRERGRDIEAVEVKTLKWFTVKLPDGTKVELPSKMRNA